jgi:hypothetical protein
MFKAATVQLKAPFSENKGRRLGEGLIGKLGQKPDVCWLFCSAQKGVKNLLKGVNDAVDTDNLIGCTTDGEVSDEGFSSESAVLVGIVTDRIVFHLSVVENLSQDCEDAGRKLAQGLPKSTRYLQLFSDGITGNGCAILRGISSVLGEEIPVSGGTAGDDGRFVRTWQFAGRKMLTDAAVALGFSGDFRLGIGVRSGWTPTGLTKAATSASGNKLFELNGEPALKVYERFLGKYAHKLPSIGVEYPLGLVGPAGNIGKTNYFLLRATMSVNREEGSISFAGEIPEGAEVSLTCGDIASVLHASEEAARLALSDLGDARVAMIFCYSCMARKIVLGSRTREEIELIRQKIDPNLPIAGFYSYGEYSPMRCGSTSYLHNETATVSVIGF